jgi:myosin heavy subunit
MSDLMNDLGQSELHFIRCIKSNNQKKAMLLEDEVLFNQICYLGILDTIKIKKMGHCVKLSYETLDKRFKWFLRHNFDKKPTQK